MSEFVDSVQMGGYLRWAVGISDYDCFRVQQVLLRGGCPFRCLGLERGASQEGVRKRYLALALRLHPDKAQHPQADEAFAALEGAYSRARDAAAADAAAS